MQNVKTTGWVRLEGATAGCLVQPPCSNNVIPEHMRQDSIQIILKYLHVQRKPPSLRMVHVQAECLKSMGALDVPMNIWCSLYLYVSFSKLKTLLG